MTALPQERRVVTAIPGPKSQELQARRTAVVAQGVGSVLPVFVARAGGGVIEDVDGNRLIDFGSGIAVTSVGASAEAVVRRRPRSSPTSPTPASWSRRTRATWPSPRRWPS
ncbi:hypothetical protein STENM223S_11150 [Streptomyces tendae]